MPGIDEHPIHDISPAARLVLSAAFCDVQPNLAGVCDDLLRAANDNEVTAAVEVSRRHKVAALVGLNLDDARPPGNGRPIGYEHLSAEYQRTLERSRDMVDDIAEVLAIAASAGVDVLVRKGIPLAVRTRGLSSRMPNDIDLLVRAEQSATLVAALHDDGFESLFPPAAATLLRIGGQNLADVARRSRGARPHEVKVGFAVRYFDRRSQLDFATDGIFERAMTLDCGGVTVPVASEIDFVVDVAAHVGRAAQSLLSVEAGNDLLLYRFSDIARLLRRLRSLGLVDVFVETVLTYDLARPIFFAAWAATEFDSGCLDRDALDALAAPLESTDYLHEFGGSEGYEGRWSGADADIVRRTFDSTRAARFSGRSRLLRHLRAT